MSTLTKAETMKIRRYLTNHPILAKGLGTTMEPCSVAAINLALTGELVDTIPECMSPVVGLWIIDVQDGMPAEIRNSKQWRMLLPEAAGTGREHEQERVNILLEWMWGTVLPTVQPVANAGGFGEVWARMLVERTADSAVGAARAARAARAANANADAAAAAADAAATTTYATTTAAVAAAADAAAYATTTAYAHAARAAAGVVGTAAWSTFDPVSVLQQLIQVGRP